MALRVRKLARELDGSAGDVLGLLHELGLARFRSPEDMVSDAIANRVRRAWAKGLRGSTLAVDDAPAGRERERRAPRDDLMAQLVPGVVPRGARAARPRAAGPAAPVVATPDVPLEAIAAPPAGAAAVETLRQEMLEALERERAAFEAERAAREQALVVERERLAAERAALRAEQARLTEQVTALRDENARLQADRGDLAEAEAALAARRLPSLVETLHARGLRGADEFERAIEGLIRLRLLRELIAHLEVADREAWSSALARSLLLVGGEVPEQLPSDLVGVRVAEERGELPGWSVLRRELGRASEALMLHGLCRVVLVGVPPRWQRLIREGFDPRIELRFVASSSTELAEDRVDAVVAWSAQGAPTDLDARPVEIRVPAQPGDVVAFARGLRDALLPPA